MSEVPDEAWEGDDCVRRTVVMTTELAERLAARAEQRDLSVSDLLAEYAEEGLLRDASGNLRSDQRPAVAIQGAVPMRADGSCPARIDQHAWSSAGVNACGAVTHTAWSASTSWTDAPGMARASFS